MSQSPDLDDSHLTRKSAAARGDFGSLTIAPASHFVFEGAFRAPFFLLGGILVPVPAMGVTESRMTLDAGGLYEVGQGRALWSSCLLGSLAHGGHVQGWHIIFTVV